MPEPTFDETDQIVAPLVGFMQGEAERLRARLASYRQPWRERLTEEERQLVQFAYVYTRHFGDRLAAWPDGRRVALIAKLADLLDGREPVTPGTEDPDACAGCNGL